MSENEFVVDSLFADIRSLVHSARRQAVQAINELPMGKKFLRRCRKN